MALTTRGETRTACLAARLTALLIAVSSLGAQSPVFTEFPVPGPGSPSGIVSGPDGNLWFTDGTGKIGRITTSGAITLFPLASGSHPWDIAAGPDGNLWFTTVNDKVGRITPSGAITEFPAVDPRRITAGPDGNIWVTEGSVNRIARITPAGTITEFSLPASGDPLVIASPTGITQGPDGNIWYVEFPRTIGRITPSGAVTRFPLSSSSLDMTSIVSGPDGALWFGQPFDSRIGRMTASGQASSFPAPGTFAERFVFRGDLLWFTSMSRLGVMTPDGSVTLYSAPLHGGWDSLEGIAVGPDGNLWLTNQPAGRIVKTSLPPLPASVPAASDTALVALAALMALASSWTLRRRWRVL